MYFIEPSAKALWEHQIWTIKELHMIANDYKIH